MLKARLIRFFEGMYSVSVIKCMQKNAVRILALFMLKVEELKLAENQIGTYLAHALRRTEK